MPEEKEKEKKRTSPLPRVLDVYTDRVVDRIQTGKFRDGCSWAILLTLAYIAVFAVVLYFLNKDLSETARIISHGNWKESLSDFFSVMLPVVLLDIAIIVIGLLLFAPVSRVATSFVIAAPEFGFRRTWPWWLAVVVIAGALATFFSVKSIERSVYLWEYQTSGAIRSSPVIAEDGNIYFTSDDRYIYALNPEGLRRWRHPVSQKSDASPVLDKRGFIYFSSRDTVFTLTPNGNYKWAYKIEGIVAAAPAIDDGIVYYLANSEVSIIAPWKQQLVHLYAFNSTGQLVWEFSTPGIAKSSPAIGKDGTVYFVTSRGYLHAVSMAGKEVWTWPEDARLKTDVHTSPVISDEGTILFGTDDGFLYAISNDGEFRWRYEADDKIRSSPVIDEDGTIFFGSHDHGFYALTPVGDTAVEPKWRFETGGPVASSAAIGSDGLVYFGSDDHHFYGLTPEGNVKVDLVVGGRIKSAPLITKQGIIYIGSNNKTLYAIRPKSRNLKLARTPWPCYGHDTRNTASLSP